MCSNRLTSFKVTVFFHAFAYTIPYPVCWSANRRFLALLLPFLALDGFGPKNLSTAAKKVASRSTLDSTATLQKFTTYYVPAVDWLNTSLYKRNNSVVCLTVFCLSVCLSVCLLLAILLDEPHEPFY